VKVVLPVNVTTQLFGAEYDATVVPPEFVTVQ